MDFEEDKETIELRRKIESMSRAELKAFIGIPSNAEVTANVMKMLEKRADRFFPPYTKSRFQRALESTLARSIQNGDTPEQQELLMTIAIPIIAKTHADRAKAARVSTDEDIAELEKISHKIRRMLSDAE